MAGITYYFSYYLMGGDDLFNHCLVEFTLTFNQIVMNK